MSNHNALTPNVSQDTKDRIESILLDELRGRDFVLVVLEYPASFIATNVATTSEAKDILTTALNKPWS